MISTAYATFLKTLNKERYNNNSANAIKDLEIFITIFVLLVVIDIVLMLYAFYCLFNSHLQWYVTLLLVLLMFSPGFGFITSIGIIFYYHSQVLPKQKISAYV